VSYGSESSGVKSFGVRSREASLDLDNCRVVKEDIVTLPRAAGTEPQGRDRGAGGDVNNDVGTGNRETTATAGLWGLNSPRLSGSR